MKRVGDESRLAVVTKTAQQSGFHYVAQDNFSDPIGQLAETRRQMCKINWLTR
jgi:hypothetical protein